MSPIISGGGGGGGSQPVITREMFLGNTTCAASAVTPLTWTKQLGDNLVDLTDPANPTIITAGVYALSGTALIGVNPATGTYLKLDIELDSNNDDADALNTAPIIPGHINNCSSASVTYYCPAGAVLHASAQHDVVGGVDVTFYARLQRLS